jgi:hypothetical protein
MTAETQHRNNNNKKKKVARREKRFVVRATEASEKIHRAVAGFPLDVLEQVNRLKRPVARIRKLQERSITATYDVVRGVTKELSLLAHESAKTREPSKAKRTARTKTRQVRRPQPAQRGPEPVRPAAATG